MSQAKATDRDWEVFWERWPKKIRKVEARKAWLAATKHTAAAAIIAGLERLLPSYLANEPRFLPDPVKWLNGERWNDATPEPSKPTGKNTGPRVPVQNEWEYNR